MMKKVYRLNFLRMNKTCFFYNSCYHGNDPHAIVTTKIWHSILLTDVWQNLVTQESAVFWKMANAVRVSKTVSHFKQLSPKNSFQLQSLSANSAKLEHKLLARDDVVHARYCLDKVTRNFLSRKGCSKNRFHTKDIARAPIQDVDF